MRIRQVIHRLKGGTTASEFVETSDGIYRDIEHIFSLGTWSNITLSNGDAEFIVVFERVKEHAPNPKPKPKPKADPVHLEAELQNTTYRVSVGCSNCGSRREIDIPKGEHVGTRACPTCRVVALRRRW